MADSREMLKIACAALEDKKAFDIKIIDISRISTLCDYIVIADGTNKKQVQALSDNVEDHMHEAGYSHKGVATAALRSMPRATPWSKQPRPAASTAATASRCCSTTNSVTRRATPT